MDIQKLRPLFGIAGGAVTLLLLVANMQKSHAALADASITLEIPPGIDLKVVAPSISYDQATKESMFSGPTTLTWSNGARLVVPSGDVILQQREPNGRQIIRIRSTRVAEK